MKRRQFIKQVALAGAAVATGVAFVVSKSGDVLTLDMVKAMVRKMKDQSIPPDENGNFYVHAHPDLEADIKAILKEDVRNTMDRAAFDQPRRYG